MSSDYERFEEPFYAGRKGQASDHVQDFSVDNKDGQVKTRKFFVQDQGDAPDVGFGRAGPDNAPWPPDEVPLQDTGGNGINIGNWYWRIFERAFGGFHRRIAQIYARHWGDAAGSLHLATRPGGGSGNDEHMQDRIVIEPDGTLHFPGVPTDEQGRLRIRNRDGHIRWMRLDP